MEVDHAEESSWTPLLAARARPEAEEASTAGTTHTHLVGQSVSSSVGGRDRGCCRKGKPLVSELQQVFELCTSDTLSIDELNEFWVLSRYACMLNWFAVDLEEHYYEWWDT